MGLFDCPDRAELAGFAVGDIPHRDFARIAQHVEGCLECEQALQALDDRSDALLSRLRQIGLGPEIVLESIPQELLARACSHRAAAQEPASPGGALPARSLGRFELLERVGAGSFGYVFRARDTELGREVAIKIPRAGHLACEEDAARFLREARSAAQLKHPGIVAIHEIGQADDGAFYLVEEFVQGTTLSEKLRSGAIPFREAAVLIAAIADALDCAHQHGVIHRDIKPANIVLDAESRPHLMDFGLAKRDADESVMTQDGQVLGTPAYMSPEQARGESRRVDARTDIYSTGVILYELLTGERPYRGNRRMLLLQVMEDEPRPPRQLNDKIPRDMETICLRAMAKSPSRRYPSARELALDLRRYLGGEPIRARPISRIERLKYWFRSNPVAASLLVAVTLGLAVGLGHLALLSSQLVQSTALESAAQQAEMLDVVNSFYSSHVVDRVQQHGIAVTHDYASRNGAIPLPATFTIESGEQIGQRSKTGMLFRLYSAYPFRSRKDGGPHDEFEKTALDVLERNPDVPYYRFEVYNGRDSLRYATPRRMEKNCIACHNNDTNSTKRDWKEDDVAGVLEIIRPLDRDIARTHEGLRGTLLLIAGVSGTLLAASGIVLLTRSRRFW